MRIKQFLKENKWQIAVLFLVLLVQCAFISQKEGYHMDEILSFQLGNAEYNPWIVPTQPEGRLAKFIHNEIDGNTMAETFGNIIYTVQDVFENRGNSKLLSYTADVYEAPVWIEREIFRDYVTVDSTDDFNYLSVYFNVKDDNHPPIHFMLLHTMSSVFRGHMEPAMGCVINLVAVMGTCILLIRIGELLVRNTNNEVTGCERQVGVVAALLYGISGSAIATTLLIRMYGVLTLLCVWLLYLVLAKYFDRGFCCKNISLIVVTMLGFWTQYFFLFYCILLAIVVCLFLIMEKRYKELMGYIRSNAIAAGVGVVLWPFSIAHVLSSGRGVETIENLGNGWKEFGERVVYFGELLLERCFGQAWLGAVVLAALLIAFAVKMHKDTGRIVLILFLPAVGYFLLAAKVSPFIVDRYIMPAFPFVMLFVAMVICGLCTKKKGYMACITAICMLASVIGYDGTYLYRGYERQMEISTEYAKYPCICLYEGYGFYDNIAEFMQYEKTLLVKPSELLTGEPRADMREPQQFVLLVKQTVDKEAVQTIMQEYGIEVMDELLEDSVHGDRLYLCRIDG